MEKMKKQSILSKMLRKYRILKYREIFTVLHLVYIVVAQLL